MLMLLPQFISNTENLPNNTNFKCNRIYNRISEHKNLFVVQNTLKTNHSRY